MACIAADWPTTPPTLPLRLLSASLLSNARVRASNFEVVDVDICCFGCCCCCCMRKLAVLWTGCASRLARAAQPGAFS